jgi:DNA-binding transcriptional regulator YbjK
MVSRRDEVLDAAIDVLGTTGMHGVTHRAVDAAAGLPSGSTSNLFRTRDALLGAVVARFVAREQAHWEAITADVFPDTPVAFAEALIAFAHAMTGPHRTLTLARYAILVEAGLDPVLRQPLATGGARANTWFTTWLRVAGSTDPGRDAPIIMNHWTGVVLHQLANPDPAFDPSAQITTLVTTLLTPQPAKA